MAEQMRHSAITVWVAWLGAGLVGTLFPVIPLVVRLPFVYYSASGSFYVYELTSVVFSAATLALCQYIVLRILIGPPSPVATMWIPVSVLATVGAYFGALLWGMTVPRTVLSISGIQASLPPGFPLLQVIFALFGVVEASLLGLAQGLLLARIFHGRNILTVWFAANVLAAVAVGVVSGVRLQEPVPADQLTDIAFLVSSAISGGLFAAVTGLALAALLRRSYRASVPAPA